MEQKTLGKLIAALRRANGYTQRELADKLGVSDKSISRWERDECAPDLTLLPVIAEIFGITTDELLRGECNSPDRPSGELPRPSQKSDRQLKNLIHQKQIRYRNLSLISTGIAAVGLIAAMICNFGFLRARIGLLVGSVFYLAAIICQICFVNLSLSDPTEEESPFDDRLRTLNWEVLTTARNVIVSAAALFIFTLPLALVHDAYWGLTAGSWLGYGLMFGAIFAVVCFLGYTLFFCDWFIKKTEPLTGRSPRNPELGKKVRRLFLRYIITALIGAILPLGGAFTVLVPETTVFAAGIEHQTYEEFKTYIEQNTDYWGEDTHLTVEPVIPDKTDDTHEVTEKLYDKDGNLLVEYRWNNKNVTRLDFNTDSPDLLPITTYTRQQIYQARALQENLFTACILLVFIESALCLGTFFVKSQKLR